MAAAAAVLCGSVYAQDSIYHFRPKASLIGPAGEAVQEPTEIVLAVPAPFGLTTGEDVSLSLSIAGDTGGISYRAGNPDAMIGLAVNPSTGAVTGTPSAAVGTEYEIAVEAVRGGTVVATSASVNRVLRTPIDVVAVPDDIMITAVMPFPVTGIGAQATGGDQANLIWSLEDAPSWLEIVPGAEGGNAMLRVKDGMDIVETPSTAVTIVASDLEGREDRSESFLVAVMPPVEKLIADDGAGGDAFGLSVSVSADGSTALVGAWANDARGTNAGAAYVFEKTGDSWVQQAKLLGDTGINDYLGYTVSLSADGSTALVGLHGDNPMGNHSGSAYVFVRNGGAWHQQAKLIASDGAANDNFGAFLALSADGSTALVGSFNDDAPAVNSGSAYVFMRSGENWLQEAKLVAGDGAANDNFGNSLALSADGSTALVGSPNDDAPYSNSGSAHVFVRDGGAWPQQSKLTAQASGGDDSASGDNFGISVSLSADGSTALVGSPNDDDRGADSGSAYVFVRSGTAWSWQAKITAENDGVAFDGFGGAVSLSADGTTALVGAKGSDDGRSNVGAAYVLKQSGGAWIHRAKLVADDSSANDAFGTSVSLSADGSIALVGATGDDDRGTDAGAAYVMPVP